MPVPTTTADILDLIRKSQLVPSERLDAMQDDPEAGNPDSVVRQLRKDGFLTEFQAEQLLKGRHKGFVLGKYRLLDRIGMGGMGQVYLAEHATMKRRVAVKVLPPDRCKNEFARERFQREAKAAAVVEHPNIVRAYDLEMDGDVAYLVMEYIEGVTLHDLIQRRGAIDPGRAAHYIWQIANGLEAIHSLSLVHRDIKPANLLLDRSGVVRILDLGLVRSELDDDALTRGEGTKMLGTADYLAPEQAIECSKVDGRADLYSLGCTAYFLMTGQPPFPLDKMSLKLIAHQTKPPQPIRTINPAIPEGLAVAVHRLLAKKPDDRYRTATDVMEALAPYVQPSYPSEEDFPTPGTATAIRSGVSLNGWVSMNMTDKSGSKASLSGSSIRFHSDTNPRIPVDQAQQQTKANATQETLPTQPGIPAEPVPAVAVPVAPATITPMPQHSMLRPSVQPTPKVSRKRDEISVIAPTPPPPVVELRVAPEVDPSRSAKGKSTAFKADRIFRGLPVDGEEEETRPNYLLAIAIVLGVLLVIVSGIAIYALRR